MSKGRASLYCFNSLTGKRDGSYCRWEGKGKCIKCQAEDRIAELKAENAKQAAEIERLSEKEIATWQTNQAQARENAQQAEHIKDLTARMQKARKSLMDMLCDPDGNPCIHGNKNDFEVIRESLDLLLILPRKESNDE